MAAAVPQAFGKQRWIFAASRQRTACGALFWGGISAVPWLAGAFAHATARAALWSVAVAIDYIPEPVRLGIATSYAHLVMVAGIVAAARSFPLRQ
jgi:low temperature requirement protein LtrA